MANKTDINGWEIIRADYLEEGPRRLAAVVLNRVNASYSEKDFYKLDKDRFMQHNEDYSYDEEKKYLLQRLARPLCRSSVRMINGKGNEVRFTWLKELNKADHYYRINYTVSGPLKNICFTKQGKKFLHIILDYVGIKSAPARKAFLILLADKTKMGFIDINTAAGLFDKGKNEEDELLEEVKVIVEEINQSTIFTFKIASMHKSFLDGRLSGFSFVIKDIK